MSASPSPLRFRLRPGVLVIGLLALATAALGARFFLQGFRGYWHHQDMADGLGAVMILAYGGFGLIVGATALGWTLAARRFSLRWRLAGTVVAILLCTTTWLPVLDAVWPQPWRPAQHVVAVCNALGSNDPMRRVGVMDEGVLVMWPREIAGARGRPARGFTWRTEGADGSTHDFPMSCEGERCLPRDASEAELTSAFEALPPCSPD